VASAKAVLGGGRKYLEKANLVEVVRWDLPEMGLYEAMLEWVEPTINVSFSATTDEFKHLFELAYKSVSFLASSPFTVSWELLPPRTQKKVLCLKHAIPGTPTAQGLDSGGNLVGEVADTVELGAGEPPPHTAL